MKLHSMLAGALLAGALLAGAAVQAATFTITGGTPYTLPVVGGWKMFDPDPAAPGLGAGDSVQRNGVLGLSGPGRVTFSLMGFEAGDTNQFLLDGDTLFTNKVPASTSVTRDLGAGLIGFAFKHVQGGTTVANGASAGYHPSLALFQLSDTSVYALFNDGYRGDKDYDDMVVRMDVAPIPLPAAAWLIVAAIGGLGAVARRRPAAPVPAA